MFTKSSPDVYSDAICRFRGADFRNKSCFVLCQIEWCVLNGFGCCCITMEKVLFKALWFVVPGLEGCCRRFDGTLFLVERDVSVDLTTCCSKLKGVLQMDWWSIGCKEIGFGCWWSVVLCWMLQLHDIGWYAKWLIIRCVVVAKNACCCSARYYSM